MLRSMEITLPNQWQPRDYQRRIWRYLEAGGKRAVAVWHRRAGKDEVCLHWAACAAMQRVGNYWHMLPEASQARKAIWDAINPHTGKRRIDEAFPPSIRAGQRDDDMRIKLVNGSVWQVVGSDNFNRLARDIERFLLGRSLRSADDRD
jgi:phage terminase large subunit